MYITFSWLFPHNTTSLDSALPSSIIDGIRLIVNRDGRFAEMFYGKGQEIDATAFFLDSRMCVCVFYKAQVYTAL
jgi:hypothetical protein